MLDITTLPSGTSTVNFFGDVEEIQLNKIQLINAPAPMANHCAEVISEFILTSLIKENK